MHHVHYAHLHVHTAYSLLDGACLIPPLIEKAVCLKMPAIAITDHGNMFGAIEFYREAMKQGIKPIIGCEVYVAPKSRFDRSITGIKETAYHLVLLARDEIGYRNLIALVSAGYLEGFYYKPRVDKELLQQHAEGLIGLSACLKGEVSRLIMTDQHQRARDVAGEYAEIFGTENFYLEVQDHGLAPQQRSNKGVVALSRELGIGLVATNDVHYLSKDKARAHEALMCIGTQSTLDDPNHLRYDTDEFYLKSTEEMAQVFAEIPDALTNTIAIAERCNLELDFSTTHLPQYNPPQGIDQKDYLVQLCEKGMAERYPEASQEIYERLEHELKIINHLGFTSYFLIVWDLIHYAKEKNIPVGPGRGSAAGCLVSYLLKITDIDPIRYDLLFERFLNPDRVSLPDIDIDFCYERRNEVIQYAVEKYSRNNVAQVITFGTMMAKAVVRDVGRVMNMSYGDVDRIAKLIPTDLNITLESALKQEPQLKQLYDTDPRITELIDISKNLEGITRHASTHAAGVVISEKPLVELIPLFKSNDGQLTTGYAMSSLEKIGLLKIDFLGLRTLTVIEETLRIIERNHGTRVDMDGLPLDDKATYDMLSRADSMGVFQLESSGMRELLRKLEPDQFEDLIALLALYRPGPIGSGMLDDFINRRHGKVKIVYDHPLLEGILKETYGIILYQEQVMHISSRLAGFSLSQADSLRRAMSKKISEIIESERLAFVTGCVKNKIDKRIADRIFDLIEYFAGYGFNRSHSTAYAMITYRTAYLKANYPTEFMTALLTSESDNTDKLVTYINAARRSGITILPPDVNESYEKFTMTGPQTIRFGLSAVKNVGQGAIESIVRVREEDGPFKSLHDFCERVDLRAVNRKVSDSLVKCGAFDSLGYRRSQLLAGLDKSLESAGDLQRDRNKGQLSFFDSAGDGDPFRKTFAELPNIPEWPEHQLLMYEKQLLGFYITGHPLAQYERLLGMFSPHSCAKLVELSDNMDIGIGGIVAKVKHTLTKSKNERMAIMLLEDLSAAVEVIVFPSVYQEYAHVIKPNEAIFVSGRLTIKDDEPKILAERIVMLDEVCQTIAEEVHIDLTHVSPTQEMFYTLKEIFSECKGTIPVVLHFNGQRDRRHSLKIEQEYFVTPSEEMSCKIEECIGEHRVSVKLQKPQPSKKIASGAR